MNYCQGTPENDAQQYFLNHQEEFESQNGYKGVEIPNTDYLPEILR